MLFGDAVLTRPPVETLSGGGDTADCKCYMMETNECSWCTGVEHISAKLEDMRASHTFWLYIPWQ